MDETSLAQIHHISTIDISKMSSNHVFPGHQDLLNSLSVTSSEMGPPKKKKRIRAKLDHLTLEQKRERRKEKNRVAAQTARDRKRENFEQVKAERDQYKAAYLKLLEQTTKNQNLNYGVAPAARGDSNLLALPRMQITDSGVSDIDSTSKSSSPIPVLDHQMEYLSIPHNTVRTATTTPNSMSDVQHAQPSISPAPSHEDQLIDSFIGQENEQQLTEEVQRVVSYIDNGATSFDSTFRSAAPISAPLPQEQVGSSRSSQLPIVNSLGWTSLQLMLVILISRVHHLSLAKIGCCPRDSPRRQQISRSGNDSHRQHGVNSNNVCMDTGQRNLSIVDYILNTTCPQYRRATEAILTSRDDIMRQRQILIEFANKRINLGLN